MKQAEYVPVQHVGLVLDKPPEEVPPGNWTGGANVSFRDGVTSRTGGWERYADPLGTTVPIFAMWVLVGPDAYWMYCTAAQVWVTNGLTHWNITPVGGLLPAAAGEWSGCILNGIPCLNNVHNHPIYWNLNTASPMVILPGWPTNTFCKALRATKYHLIALNITEAGVAYPNQVFWSSGAQAGSLPAAWTPAANNDAGDVVCGDTPGPIIDGLALRDSFIIYKEFSCYVMQYVAGQYVFTTRKLFTTTGVAALNCAVEANGLHWVFTGTDVIRHDGQSYVSVVDEKVKRDLVLGIDPTKRGMCCVAARQLDQQVWVCIPQQGSTWLSKAYVIDAETDNCGIRLLPNVAYVGRGIVTKPNSTNQWDTYSAPWASSVRYWEQQTYNPTQDSLLMVDPVGSHLFNVDAIATADGAPVYAFVERLGGSLGSFISHKVVTALVPRIEGNPGDVLQITMGGQAWFNQPISWGQPQDFVIGTDVAVTDIVEGRLLSVRFEGTTQNVWNLHKYSVKFAEIGEL